MKKIVLAFDSFKGSANSLEIANSAELALKEELPDCRILKFPIADGGEGTTDAICKGLDAIKVTCLAHDPLMREIEVTYAISKDGETAILEMASASGLTLLEQGLRNPMNTTTYGTGEIVQDALRRGCRKFVLGIGGSVTNDAGIGMLAALGARFFDIDGIELVPVGKNLKEIEKIDLSDLHSALKESSFTIACDVNNPLFGEQGAAYIYAPQKGASEIEVSLLDDGLRHYARIIEQTTGLDITSVTGGGAAGGMGGGLTPFLNARLQSGIYTVLDILGLEEAIEGADLILTGEGKIDIQTTMGKALGGILKLANKYNVPTVAITGAVESTLELNKLGFTAVFSIQPAPVSLEESMQAAFVDRNVRRVVSQIIRIVKRFSGS